MWNFETLKTRSQETLKPGNQETKTPMNLESFYFRVRDSPPPINIWMKHIGWSSGWSIFSILRSLGWNTWSFFKFWIYSRGHQITNRPTFEATVFVFVFLLMNFGRVWFVFVIFKALWLTFWKESNGDGWISSPRTCSRPLRFVSVLS